MHKYSDAEISALNFPVPNVTEDDQDLDPVPNVTEDDQDLQFSRSLAAYYGYENVQEYEDEVELYQSAHVPEEGDATDEENYLSKEEDMTTAMAEYGYPPILNNYSAIRRSGAWVHGMDRRLSDHYVKPPSRSKDEEDHLNQIASQYGYWFILYLYRTTVQFTTDLQKKYFKRSFACD